MKLWLGFRRVLGLSRRRRAFCQFRGLTDEAIELGVGRQFIDRLDLAELTHGADDVMARSEFLTAPEVQRHVRFERGGDQDDFAADHVGRHAPLDRFFHVRKHRVDAYADMFEDRPGEGLSFGDVGIDPRIPAHRIPPPSMSRTTPITVTNRLRFRPAVPRETMPMTAPMIASGTISQLAQPRKGMKATSAQISATKPIISETRLNIGSA